MIVWGVDRFPPVAGCWVFRLGGHWIPVRQSVAKAQCRPVVSGRRYVVVQGRRHQAQDTTIAGDIARARARAHLRAERRG